MALTESSSLDTGIRVRGDRNSFPLRLIQNRVAVLIAILLLYNVLFILFLPHRFFRIGNYTSVLMNMSIESFIVIGMTVLLISGNLDLSLGSIMALSGIICGYLIKYSALGVASSIGLAVAAAILMGLVNGYIVAFVEVNPVITTLATGFVYQGIAVWLAGPGLIAFPGFFQMYGQARFLGLQAPVWYMLVATLIFQLLMGNSRFFRRYYFVGGNKSAALLSGIDARKTVLVAFVIAAVLASLAGVISASRFNSSMTSVGTGVELRAITAAVVGGVSFTGGTGSILGAVLGFLFLTFVNNGLILVGIAPSWQNVIVGVVLIASIIVDVTFGNRK